MSKTQLGNYKIEICNGEANLLWDELVLSSKDTSYQQSSAWSQVYNQMGWRTVRLFIWEGDQLVGGTQIFIRTLGRLLKIGFIAQGPVLRIADDGVLDLLVNEVKEWSKKNRLFYLVWDVNYAYSHLAEKLLHGRFQEKVNGLPPTAIIRATTLLDLSQSSDDLFARMSKSRQRNIKKALQYPITYKSGTRDDLPIFFELMQVMCQRRTTNPIFGSLDFFYTVWDAFDSISGIQLNIAYVNKEPVCAMLCFALGDTYRFWQWGWSGKYAELQVTHALYWHTINKAKSQGYKKIDFIQVDAAVGRAYEQGSSMTPEMKGGFFYGPTINKMRYGGELVIYPGKFMYVPSLFIRFLLVRFGERLINGSFLSKVCKKLIVKSRN